MERKLSPEQKIVSRAVGILRGIDPSDVKVEHRQMIAYALGLLEAILLNVDMEDKDDDMV